ncbi:MAG: ATP-binding protein [Anaerolineales bacterium]|nr:ATP-binding protein [Anaerolineales bacterium]
MKNTEIEFWTLSVIERVKNKQPVEDDRVELKSNWIEPANAARRIAGHANAARGENILWLIGVDEKEGVTGVDYKDYAEWFSKVNSQFDNRLAPDATCINVPYEGLTVLAIVFNTDRAPYVVKNPNGGAIQFEVPWRDNTSIKTANRSQLLQILVPSQNIPKINALSGNLLVREGYHDKDWHWEMTLQLYVSSYIQTPLVIPFHQCNGYFDINQISLQVPLSSISLYPPPLGSGGWTVRSIGISNSTPIQRPEHDSLTIDGTSTELLINGPGKFKFTGSGRTSPIEKDIQNSTVKVKASLQPIASDRFIHIDLDMEWQANDKDNSNTIGSWKINQSP